MSRMARTAPMSWMGSAQKGPPISQPAPVSGQACGTAGPPPGMYLVLLPLVMRRPMRCQWKESQPWDW